MQECGQHLDVVLAAWGWWRVGA